MTTAPAPRKRHGPLRLTQKQSVFSGLVASGMSYTDAYLTAYDVAEETSRNTVMNEAHRLAKTPKIKAQIALLRNGREYPEVRHGVTPMLSPAEAEAAEDFSRSPASIRKLAVDTLLGVVRSPKTKATDRLKAIGLLSKIPGVALHTADHAPQEERSPEEITAELRRRLMQLLTDMQEASEDEGPARLEPPT